MQDISVTLPVGPVPYNTPIFSNCDSTCLNSYEYLVISSSSYPLTSMVNPFLNLLIKFDSLKNPRNLNFNLYTSDTYLAYRLPFDGSYTDNRLLYGSMNDTIAPITFTLTNSLGGPAPSGNLDISQNGTYDVSSYATATVDVPVETVQGDYHNDLVNLNQAIYVVPATLLVIYFFYCIYRMIIKTVGGV